MRFEKTFLPLMLAFASLIVAGVMTNKTALKSDLNTIDIKKPPDLLMYYNGAVIAKNNGFQKLYDLQLQKISWDKVTVSQQHDGLLAFRGPPVLAWLLKPLAGLTYTDAYFLLVFINFLAVGALMLIYKHTKTIDKEVWKKLLPALGLFVPLWVNIHGGQISIFILLFISLVYLFFSSGKFFHAGLFLGLVFIKPQYLNLIPLVLVLYFRHKHFKRILLGLGSSLLFMILVNSYFFGLDFITKYPSFLLFSESVSYGTDPFFNYNISSLLSLLFPLQHGLINMINLVINSVLYLILLSFLIKKNRQINKDVAFAAVLMFGPLINLHTMPVDIVVFLLPLYIVCTYFYQRGELKKIQVFAVLMLLLPWGAYFYLNFVTTIIFMIIGGWVLKESFTPVKTSG